MNRVLLCIQKGISTPFPFWARPTSSFGLFCHNDVYQQFSSLSHIVPACSLAVLLLTALPSPHGFSFVLADRATLPRSVSSQPLPAAL